MTKEEAIEEINKVFEPAFANYIITALTKGATASDKALKQEPCEDCVSREAVLQGMYDLCNTGETLKENPWRDNPHIDAIIDTIENLPPVTPKPKTGKWIIDGHHRRCSICENSFCVKDREGDMIADNFCPNCGAKMEGVSE